MTRKEKQINNNERKPWRNFTLWSSSLGTFIPSPAGGTWRDFYCQVPPVGLAVEQNIPIVSHGTHNRPIGCVVTWCSVPPMALRLRTFRCFNWILMETEEAFCRMGPINEKLMRKTSEKRDFTDRFFWLFHWTGRQFSKRKSTAPISTIRSDVISCILAHFSYRKTNFVDRIFLQRDKFYREMRRCRSFTFRRHSIGTSRFVSSTLSDSIKSNFRF